MNDKVDVLAVMNYASEVLDELGFTGRSSSLDKARAAVAELVAGYEQIKHSIQQARIPGNDWRRELALIENTSDAALARVKGE